MVKQKRVRVNMGAFRMAALAASEGKPFEMPPGSVVPCDGPCSANVPGTTSEWKMCPRCGGKGTLDLTPEVDGINSAEKALARDAARRLRPPPEWSKRVEGKKETIDVDLQGTVAGWALFSGCEGEDPTFVAFFAGRHGKARAETFMRMTDEDGEPEVFDGDVAPAVLVSGPYAEEPGLYVANHFDHDEGVAALAKEHGLDPDCWREKP